MSVDDRDRLQDSALESPPVLGSWRNLYVVLLVELAVVVAAFWALTWWAS